MSQYNTEGYNGQIPEELWPDLLGFDYENGQRRAVHNFFRGAITAHSEGTVSPTPFIDGLGEMGTRIACGLFSQQFTGVELRTGEALNDMAHGDGIWLLEQATMLKEYIEGQEVASVTPEDNLPVNLSPVRYEATIYALAEAAGEDPNSYSHLFE